jgi:hypothetical protein
LVRHQASAQNEGIKKNAEKKQQIWWFKNKYVTLPPNISQ